MLSTLSEGSLGLQELCEIKRNDVWIETKTRRKKREREICGSLLACWDSGRWWAEVELIFEECLKTAENGYTENMYKFGHANT